MNTTERGPDPERFEGTRKIRTTHGMDLEVAFPEYLDLHRAGLIGSESKSTRKEAQDGR